MIIKDFKFENDELAIGKWGIMFMVDYLQLFMFLKDVK